MSDIKYGDDQSNQGYVGLIDSVFYKPKSKTAKKKYTNKIKSKILKGQPSIQKLNRIN